MAINGETLDYLRGQSVTADIQLAIARLKIPGVIPRYKFGKSTAINASNFETIWREGGSYITPTTATTASIVSTSTNDTAAGTGARTLYVEGLDSDYNLLSETVTLNGTTPVLTTGEYLRFNRMFILTAGSLKTSGGTIRATVDSKVCASIIPEDNQSEVCHYTVPAGYTAYVNQLQFSVGQGKEVEIQVRVRWPGEESVYRTVSSFFVYQASSNIHIHIPLAVPEKSDLQFIAKSAAGTVAVAAVFDTVLISDNID